MSSWCVFHPGVLLFLHHACLPPSEIAPFGKRMAALAFSSIVLAGFTYGVAESENGITDAVATRFAFFMGLHSFVCLSFPSGEPFYGIVIPAGIVNVVVMLAFEPKRR